jgi:hypothetical protein
VGGGGGGFWLRRWSGSVHSEKTEISKQIIEI